MTTAMVSMNAVVSHWAVAAPTSNSTISFGSATLMIVSLRMTTNAAPTRTAISRPARGAAAACGSAVPAGAGELGGVEDTRNSTGYRSELFRRYPVEWRSVRDVLAVTLFAQRILDLLLRPVERFGRGILLGRREVEGAEGVGREDVQMQVGDFQTGDHQAGARGVEGGGDGAAEDAGDVVHLRPQVVVDALPVIDLLPRHDQHMPLGEGIDGQEGDDVVVLPDETARQFTGDDLAEHGSHTGRIRDTVFTGAVPRHRPPRR